MPTVKKKPSCKTFSRNSAATVRRSSATGVKKKPAQKMSAKKASGVQKKPAAQKQKAAALPQVALFPESKVGWYNASEDSYKDDTWWEQVADQLFVNKKGCAWLGLDYDLEDELGFCSRLPDWFLRSIGVFGLNPEAFVGDTPEDPGSYCGLFDWEHGMKFKRSEKFRQDYEFGYLKFSGGNLRAVRMQSDYDDLFYIRRDSLSKLHKGRSYTMASVVYLVSEDVPQDYAELKDEQERK